MTAQIPTTEQEEEHFRAMSSWPFVSDTQTSCEKPGQKSDSRADDGDDLQGAYEIRASACVVVRRGMGSWHDSATFIALADEGFVEVSQIESTGDKQTISIDPDEWPTLRMAIDQMIAACSVS